MIVTTNNSTYTVDFATQTVLRTTAGGPLRKDDEPVRFIMMDQPRINQRWALELIGLSEDPQVTSYRLTTQVNDIEGVEEWEQWRDAMLERSFNDTVTRYGLTIDALGDG